MNRGVQLRPYQAERMIGITEGTPIGGLEFARHVCFSQRSISIIGGNDARCRALAN